MSAFPFLHLRVMLTRETLLGPGKADLLQSVSETGFIAAGSRRMTASGGASVRRVCCAGGELELASALGLLSKAL